MNNDWLRVSKQRPCPICQTPDYCGVTNDGAGHHQAGHCQAKRTAGSLVAESESRSRGRTGITGGEHV